MRPSLILLAVLSLGSIPPAAGAEPPDFDRVVAPILARKCLDCHSGADPKGKLDLSRKHGALAGGSSGPAITPEQPEESLLLEQVENGTMPPKGPLSREEMEVLRGWIRSGARWGSDPIDVYRFTTAARAGRDWWSLRPLRRPDVPDGPDGEANDPIDAFVLSRLSKAGLHPVPRAGPRVLVRRVAFALTGMPPTPAEVETFVQDARPDAYARMVDQYLASPQYGVRWARAWLDLARFGESHGFEHDEFRPDAWRYRDWVVRAFNSDMPFSEFARLQLAGDLLSPSDPQSIEATGFLVSGAFDSVGQSQQSEAMRKVVRQDEMEDIVGTVGQTFLGLSVHCARCHDHKFDPIPQADYYRIAAALDGVRHGVRDLAMLDPEIREAQDRLRDVSARLAALRSPTEVRQRAVLLAELERLAAQVVGSHRAYVVTPGSAGAVHRLSRGDPRLPAEVVAPGGLSALDPILSNLAVPATAPDHERRTRLAEWISDARNPLFARTIVNRIWRWHFGKGLVETPSDLGFNGGLPSHPELLDWLASDLIAHGWSLKHLHRRILGSAAFQRSSRLEPGGQAVDAGNRLLWRKAPMRLDAEMARDAMLSVAGVLEPSLGGPGFRDFAIHKAVGTITTQYQPIEANGPGFARRTLYRTWARGGRSGFLDALDCPDPSTTCPVRPATNTPLQALAMLNNAMVLHLSGQLAGRLASEAGNSLDSQIEHAYRLAFSRAPSGDESRRAREVAERHGMDTVCRAIFNSNEFLFID